MQDIIDRTSTEDLRKAISRAEQKIRTIASQQRIEMFADPGDDFDGPFPPSKAFETWLANFNDRLQAEIDSLRRVRDEFRTEVQRREKLAQP